ncbi:hypothetical protein [Mesorhizobium sp. CAU 1741]|uniref:hypothetical protein n=1 Tax=Mesorhizobium sp. CAU 1741 TaxID=3140366 RepID=UPI00325BE62A
MPTPATIIWRSGWWVIADAALAEFDQGKLVTIPALVYIDGWKRPEEARLALGEVLSRAQPAPRYWA